MEQTNGPRSPGGIPISSRILVPAGAPFDPVRRALAAIDAVHGDGDLPRLPVVRTRAATEAGAYEWNDRTGQALSLRFSGLGEHPELTVVHEIGHFLDHQALGRRGSFASETGGIAAIMHVIDQSAAVRALTALRRRRIVTIQVRGRREIEHVDHRRVEYFLKPGELFARAYAQHIALASRSPTLLAQVDADRKTRPAAVYHYHWNDDDFGPIRLVLDRFLWSRRWMTIR